jgi:hypothetical protein
MLKQVLKKSMPVKASFQTHNRMMINNHNQPGLKQPRQIKYISKSLLFLAHKSDSTTYCTTLSSAATPFIAWPLNNAKYATKTTPAPHHSTYISGKTIRPFVYLTED